MFTDPHSRRGNLAQACAALRIAPSRIQQQPAEAGCVHDALQYVRRRRVVAQRQLELPVTADRQHAQDTARTLVVGQQIPVVAADMQSPQRLRQSAGRESGDDGQ